MNKTYETIDVAKFVASILVFAMHCNILGGYGQAELIPQMLARWGVPFFFICSAFFLFSKAENGNIEKEFLKKYISRIAVLYGAWLIFNLPSVCIRLYKSNILSLHTWLRFLRDALLSSTFIGSWYLLSSIFSVCFVYALGKKLRTSRILGISFIFYLLCVFTSSYSGILPAGFLKGLRFFSFPLNIFNGCFYFALGKYFAENIHSIKKRFNKSRSIIAFALSYLLFIFEEIMTNHFYINGGTDVAFSTALMAIFLFLFCLQTDINIKNSLLLRKLSIVIYCAQGNVLLLNELCKIRLKLSPIVAFFISACVMALICAAVLFVQKQKKLKWAKYLT